MRAKYVLTVVAMFASFCVTGRQFAAPGAISGLAKRPPPKLKLPELTMPQPQPDGVSTATPEEREKMAKHFEELAEKAPPKRAARYREQAKHIRKASTSVTTRPATIEDLQPILERLEMLEKTAPEFAEQIKKESDNLKLQIENLKIQKSKTEK